MCVLNICINCPKFFRTHCISNTLFLFQDEKGKLYSYIPRGHTCANILELPRGNLTDAVPSVEELFPIYDLAFLNNYFVSA